MKIRKIQIGGELKNIMQIKKMKYDYTITVSLIH